MILNMKDIKLNVFKNIYQYKIDKKNNQISAVNTLNNQ